MPSNEDAKRVFAARLRKLTTERGWNQSDLARYASQHLPDDRQLNRDNVSNYFNAKALPSDVFLSALAKALNMAPDDLLPERTVTPPSSTPASTGLTDLGDGYVHLRVNKRVPWMVALKILEMVNEQNLAEIAERRMPPAANDE